MTLDPRFDPIQTPTIFQEVFTTEITDELGKELTFLIRYWGEITTDGRKVLEFDYSFTDKTGWYFTSTKQIHESVLEAIYQREKFELGLGSPDLSEAKRNEI